MAVPWSIANSPGRSFENTLKLMQLTIRQSAYVGDNNKTGLLFSGLYIFYQFFVVTTKWLDTCPFNGLGSNYIKHDKFYFLSLKVIISCSWIFGVILNIPEFLVRSFDKEVNFCTLTFPEEWMGKAYSWIWCVLLAFLPVSLMTALYSRVVYALWFKRTEPFDGNNLQQVWNKNQALKL